MSDAPAQNLLTDTTAAPAAAPAPDGAAPAPAAQNLAEGATAPQASPDPAGSQGDSGSPDADQAPDGKGGESPPSPPERYEFKVPDGVQLDEDLTSTMTEIWRNANLPLEVVQAQVDQFVAYQQRQAEAFAEAIEQRSNQQKIDLLELTKKDPELGGDNLKATAITVQRVVSMFGNDTVREIMDRWPEANHPEILRMFRKLGEHFNEDSHIPAGNSASHQRVPLEKLWYPNHQEG